MPGAGGLGAGFSKEYTKNNPGVTEISSTFPKQKPGKLAQFGFDVTSVMGKRAAQQIADPTRTDIPGTRIVSVTPAKAGKTPLVNTASKGRVPSGKRARKHNVRRG